MNQKQAIKLAIEALTEYRHRFAVDANFFDLYGATYPHAENASKKRAKINEAIEVLKSIAINGKGEQ